MPILLTALPLLSALVWVTALAIDPGPWDEGAVLLIGIGLIVTATVGVVGLSLTGGRWSSRSCQAVLLGTALLAVVRPIDGWWVAGTVLTAISFVALSTPLIRRQVRKLPAATGPPERAVLLTMVLLGAPFAIGAMAWTGTNWATVVVGVCAPVAGFWYSRVLPGGLYLARYGWPLLALALAFTQPVWAAAGCVVIAIGVAVIAADPAVKVAFYPPRQAGTAYPIPPELAPPEVLDAADLDERGRKR